MGLCTFFLFVSMHVFCDFRFLQRWPVQRPLRALGKLGLQEMVFFLNTTPAVWNWLVHFKPGLACSALLPSLLAPGPAPAPCTSITLATLSSRCRRSACHIHYFTSTRRSRISPRLTSNHLLYHPHLILCHFTIREEKLMKAFQESSQVKGMVFNYNNKYDSVACILCSSWSNFKV